MERGGNSQQSFADQKKEKPRCHHGRRALGKPQIIPESRALGERQPGHLFETGGTDHAVFVFGNALAAEKPATLRAARHRLAGGMVEAALVKEM